MNIITLGGGIVLARILTPAQFGIFGIATFFVNTLALFGDCGLAPSLVQRKRELELKDLQVAFTLQLILLTIVAISIWIAAPYFLLLYGNVESSDVLWLIRTVAIMLFIQSWRSISMLQMEREVNFKDVARIEVVETLGYQILAVALAFFGLGVWSLVAATLFRSTVGAVLAYMAAPWQMKLQWDREVVRDLLHFGIPFQASKLANSLGTWVTPVLVGSLLGPAAVGYITWASGLASKPLDIMGTVQRVAFPHLSRMQDDQINLARTFGRYLIPVLLLSGYCAVIVLLVGAKLVPIVYGDDWIPAILLLQIISCLMVLRVANWLLGTLMKSYGDVKYVVWVAAATTGIFAVTAAITTPSLGILSVPIALGMESAIRFVAFAARVDSTIRVTLLQCFLRTLIPSGLAIATSLSVLLAQFDPITEISCMLVIASFTFAVGSWITTPRDLRASILERAGKLLKPESPSVSEA